MEANCTEILRILIATITQAKADGGATYDRMAQNIRKHAAEGLIAEAIGYVPQDVESVSAEDVFRPRKNFSQKGVDQEKFYKKNLGSI